MNALSYPIANNAAFGFPQATADSADDSQRGNPKAACTNCRQSHVACSHELPCSRCLNLGIEDSCRYLPRKRRTDFKKRKQEIEKTKKIKAADAPVVPFTSTPAVGEENEGLLNATLAQLFGEEYPFPLLDSNQHQPGHEGLTGNADSALYSSEEDTEESTDWISKLSRAISPRMEGLEQAGWPQPGKALEYDGVPASPAFAGANPGETFGSGLELVAPVQRPEEDQRLTPYSDSARTSSKTLRLLQELKQKNDRLEQLLRNSLNDIQRLKERELMYQQQVQNFMREEQKSFQLFSLGPARDFDQPGMMPGIAMFSLVPSRRHQMLQCNQAFQTLVGRSWQELSQGFTSCQMFPQRLLPLLRQRFAGMCSKEGPSSAEAELLITRPGGEEVPIKAYSHVIFDDAGEPLYKMFYAFALNH